MTCVVAIVDEDKNIHMGSDGLASDSHSQTIITDPKFFFVGEMLIGFAGSFRSAQVLQYQAFLPDRTELQEDLEYLIGSFIPAVRDVFAANGLYNVHDGAEIFEGEFLIGYRGKIYKMQNDFSLIHAVDDFAAIGAGGEVGNAVMYATNQMQLTCYERLALALESSAYQISTVKAPFHYISAAEDGEILENSDDMIGELPDHIVHDKE